MHETGWVELALEAIGIGIQILIAVVTVTWTAGKVTRGLEREAQDRLDAFKQETQLEFEEMRQHIGEVGAALRTKVTEVEFYMRDNYVNNDMLDKIVKLFGENMRLQFENLGQRVDDIKHRMEDRLKGQ